MRYEYKTEQVCSQIISFDINGNTCGRRPTSCTDQLAKAVRTAYNESV